MKLELLPPNTVISQLQERLQQLKEALLELTKKQKNQQKGHLRVSQRGSARPQYYHYTTPTDFTGKYIRKKNLAFAKTLAQKDYEENIIPLLQKEIAELEKYLTQTSNSRAILELYDSLCPAPAAALLRRWLSQTSSTRPNGKKSPGQAGHLRQMHLTSVLPMASGCAQNPK